MFITVRHGDNVHQLFNPDCALRLLVEDVKKRCHCPTGLTVALLDDKLSVIHLPELSLDYASSLVTDRGEYILVGVERGDRGHSKYTSLLDHPEPELLAKLEALSHPQGLHPTPRKAGKKPSKTALMASTKGRKTSTSSRSRGK